MSDHEDDEIDEQDQIDDEFGEDEDNFIDDESANYVGVLPNSAQVLDSVRYAHRKLFENMFIALRKQEFESFMYFHFSLIQSTIKDSHSLIPKSEVVAITNLLYEVITDVNAKPTVIAYCCRVMTAFLSVMLKRFSRHDIEFAWQPLLTMWRYIHKESNMNCVRMHAYLLLKKKFTEMMQLIAVYLAPDGIQKLFAHVMEYYCVHSSRGEDTCSRFDFTYWKAVFQCFMPSCVFMRDLPEKQFKLYEQHYRDFLDFLWWQQDKVMTKSFPCDFDPITMILNFLVSNTYFIPSLHVDEVHRLFDILHSSRAVSKAILCNNDTVEVGRSIREGYFVFNTPKGSLIGRMCSQGVGCESDVARTITERFFVLLQTLDMALHPLSPSTSETARKMLFSFITGLRHRVMIQRRHVSKLTKAKRKRESQVTTETPTTTALKSQDTEAMEVDKNSSMEDEDDIDIMESAEVNNNNNSGIPLSQSDHSQLGEWYYQRFEILSQGFLDELCERLWPYFQVCWQTVEGRKAPPAIVSSFVYLSPDFLVKKMLQEFSLTWDVRFFATKRVNRVYCALSGYISHMVMRKQFHSELSTILQDQLPEFALIYSSAYFRTFTVVVLHTPLAANPSVIISLLLKCIPNVLDTIFALLNRAATESTSGQARNVIASKSEHLNSLSLANEFFYSLMPLLNDEQAHSIYSAVDERLFDQDCFNADIVLHMHRELHSVFNMRYLYDDDRFMKYLTWLEKRNALDVTGWATEFGLDSIIFTRYALLMMPLSAKHALTSGNTALIEKTRDWFKKLLPYSLDALKRSSNQHVLYVAQSSASAFTVGFLRIVTASNDHTYRYCDLTKPVRTPSAKTTRAHSQNDAKRSNLVNSSQWLALTTPTVFSYGRELFNMTLDFICSEVDFIAENAGNGRDATTGGDLTNKLAGRSRYQIERLLQLLMLSFNYIHLPQFDDYTVESERRCPGDAFFDDTDYFVTDLDPDHPRKLQWWVSNDQGTGNPFLLTYDKLGPGGNLRSFLSKTFVKLHRTLLQHKPVWLLRHVQRTDNVIQLLFGVTIPYWNLFQKLGSSSKPMQLYAAFNGGEGRTLLEELLVRGKVRHQSLSRFPDYALFSACRQVARCFNFYWKLTHRRSVGFPREALDWCDLAISSMTPRTGGSNMDYSKYFIDVIVQMMAHYPSLSLHICERMLKDVLPFTFKQNALLAVYFTFLGSVMMGSTMRLMGVAFPAIVLNLKDSRTESESFNFFRWCIQALNEFVMCDIADNGPWQFSPETLNKMTCLFPAIAAIECGSDKVEQQRRDVENTNRAVGDAILQVMSSMSLLSATVVDVACTALLWTGVHKRPTQELATAVVNALLDSHYVEGPLRLLSSCLSMRLRRLPRRLHTTQIESDPSKRSKKFGVREDNAWMVYDDTNLPDTAEKWANTHFSDSVHRGFCPPVAYPADITSFDTICWYGSDELDFTDPITPFEQVIVDRIDEIIDLLIDLRSSIDVGEDGDEAVLEADGNDGSMLMNILMHLLRIVPFEMIGPKLCEKMILLASVDDESRVQRLTCTLAASWILFSLLASLKYISFTNIELVMTKYVVPHILPLMIDNFEKVESDQAQLDVWHGTFEDLADAHIDPRRLHWIFSYVAERLATHTESCAEIMSVFSYWQMIPFISKHMVPIIPLYNNSMCRLDSDKYYKMAKNLQQICVMHLQTDDDCWPSTDVFFKDFIWSSLPAIEGSTNGPQLDQTVLLKVLNDRDNPQAEHLVRYGLNLFLFSTSTKVGVHCGPFMKPFMQLAASLPDGHQNTGFVDNTLTKSCMCILTGAHHLIPQLLEELFSFCFDDALTESAGAPTTARLRSLVLVIAAFLMALSPSGPNSRAKDLVSVGWKCFDTAFGDSSVVVNLAAAQMLSMLMQIGVLKLTPTQIDEMCSSLKRGPSQVPKGTHRKRELLNLCALIASDKFRVPSWMPAVVVAVAEFRPCCKEERDLVEPVCRGMLKAFMRSHQDTWLMDKHHFTELQLESITQSLSLQYHS